MPELLCRVCGGPKPPKQRCWSCYTEGRIHGRKVVTDPAVQLQLKTERAAKRQKWREKEFAARKSVAGRVNTRRGIRNRRTFQCRELDRLLSSLVECFERDSTGQWQLYEDRAHIARGLLDDISFELPKIRKIYKYLPD